MHQRAVTSCAALYPGFAPSAPPDARRSWRFCALAWLNHAGGLERGGGACCPAGNRPSPSGAARRVPISRPPEISPGTWRWAANGRWHRSPSPETPWRTARARRRRAPLESSRVRSSEVDSRSPNGARQPQRPRVSRAEPAREKRMLSGLRQSCLGAQTQPRRRAPEPPEAGQGGRGERWLRPEAG